MFQAIAQMMTFSTLANGGMAETGTEVVTLAACKAFQEDPDYVVTLPEWRANEVEWFKADVEDAIYMCEQEGEWF